MHDKINLVNLALSYNLYTFHAETIPLSVHVCMIVVTNLHFKKSNNPIQLKIMDIMLIKNYISLNSNSEERMFKILTRSKL